MSEGCRYLCFVPRLPSEEARRLGGIPERFWKLRGRVRSASLAPDTAPVVKARPSRMGARGSFGSLERG